MKEIKAFLASLMILVSSVAFAQNITVKGKVVDATTNEPLFGYVTLVGSTTVYAEINGVDGTYSISVPSDGVLAVETTGYKRAEIAVRGQKTINFFLQPDAEMLQGTVFVGYGSSKKVGNIVGAVTTVTADIVNNTPAASAMDALQGQVAGMQVLTSGGVAGDNNVSLKIHGSGSLTSTSQPLFIVDGVQTSSAMVMSLNPNDIQAVTVLKDASSTSIYGSLGANGVVYITTKAGNYDSKARVTITSQYGISTLANLQFYENMMSGDELKNFWIRSGIQTVDSIYDTYTSKGYTANTKWHTVMQRLNNPQYQNDLTIEGGSNTVAYLISASQFHQDGTAFGNYYDRYTLRSNLQARPATWIKAGANVTVYMTEDRQNDNWGDSSGTDGVYTSGGASYLQNPLFPVINPETGKLYEEKFPNGVTNPAYYFEKRHGVDTKFGLNGAAFLEVEPLKNLILTSRVGTDAFVDQFDFFLMPSATFTDISQRYISDYYMSRSTITNTAEYSFNLGKSHEFSVLAGQEYVYYDYKSNNANSQGQTDDRMMLLQQGDTDTYKMSQSHSQYAFLSFFGHADYNYAGKYFLDATVRYDASSRFGANYRWAPFWALGGMWKITQEDFMKDYPWVNDLNLHVSYGTQGNANIPNYEHIATVSMSSGSYAGDKYLYVGSPANPDLHWENQALFTTTLDGQLFKSLDFELTFYNRTTTDMLMSVPQPYTTGFTTLTANVGSLVNRGFDLTLGYDILKGKEYGLNAHTTFSFNREKVTSLFDGRERWEIANTMVAFVVGKPVMFYSPIYAGVDPEDGAPMWYLPGENIDDCTMDPTRVTKVFNEEELTQNTGLLRNEPISGGFGLRGFWKNFSFNVDFAYFLGKNLVNNDAYFYANPAINTTENQIKSVSDFWTPETPNAKFPDWSKGYSMQFDTHVIEDASFLRLKSLVIGYSVPKSWLGVNSGLKGLRITATGRNLLTFTNYTGIDPEVDSNLTVGLPGNSLQILGGIELTF